MKRAIAFMTVFVAVAFLPASATIINIPDDYPTIQEGIDASADGDTVLVQPGTYVENINFYGHNIVLGSLFLTTGDTTFISQTVIDGDSLGSVVTFESGEDSTTIIAGFALRHGIANLGGGIYCTDGSGPTIMYNIIRLNSATGNGGGIATDSSGVIITNNIIGGNTASHGGGIYCEESSFLIANNDISQNTVSIGGAGIYCVFSEGNIYNNTISENLSIRSFGGIYCLYTSGTIKGNSIMRNEATVWHGGGITIHSSDLEVIDNIISGNSAGHTGGGIRCLNPSNVLIAGNIVSDNSAENGGGIWCHYLNASISNNIIYRNTAIYGGGIFNNHSNPTIRNNVIFGNLATFGGGIYCLSSSPVIKNTIFWADSAQHHREIWADTSSALIITYCDIQDTLWPGEGNIDVDPLFRDPENNDFHLMSTACGDPFVSPCIDAGHPDILDSLLDCSWGLGGLRSDMGAYSGGDSVTVGIDDYEMPLPEHLALLQNYPNPFNASTVIRYSLPEPADVKIDIYDILGRRIETLMQGEQPAGYHQIIWNAEKRSSGMYFYRIQAGEYSDTKKMLLLK